MGNCFLPKVARGVAGRCKVLEDMRQSVREETQKKSAENLIDMRKLTLEEISGAVGLPVEKIKEIADDLLTCADER